MESVYRVSYPPFQAAPENQYITIQKYLQGLKIVGGSEEKQLMHHLLQYLAPHVLIDSESGIPYLKYNGQKLKTPITQLVSYFFDVKFAAEMPLTQPPIDAADFLKFLKHIRLPSKYLKMILRKTENVM